MSGPIRIGILGCGAIVQAVHLPALSRLGSFAITAIAEPDARRRAEAAARLPAAIAHSDWRNVIGDPNINAVLIGLPTGLHAECAVAALEAGKYVYLEKPIATSLTDADRVIAAWRASGRVGMIGFNYRYSPLYAALKQDIASGRIGEVVAVRSVFCTTVAQVPAWKRSRETGGGVLLDLGSHHVDLLPFLLDSEIRSVSSGIRSIMSEQDTATIDATFANGVQSQSFFSLAAVEEDRIEVFGRAGKLAVDRYASLEVEFTPARRAMPVSTRVRRMIRPALLAPARARKILARGYEPSYTEAFSNFARAIRGHSSASPDLLDGFKSLAVIDAAERSNESGARVELVPQNICATALEGE